MDTRRDPEGNVQKNAGRAHRHILGATAAMQRAYAWTALPAEAVGAVMITGFIALAMAHAWLPGFQVPNEGPLKTAAAAWMLAAIMVYMLYGPCKYCEEDWQEPRPRRGWKQTAWETALLLPMGLIAAGFLMAAWDSPAAMTAAGYTLFAGLAGAALRTLAGLAGRARRRMKGKRQSENGEHDRSTDHPSMASPRRQRRPADTHPEETRPCDGGDCDP